MCLVVSVEGEYLANSCDLVCRIHGLRCRYNVKYPHCFCGTRENARRCVYINPGHAMPRLLYRFKARGVGQRTRYCYVDARVSLRHEPDARALSRGSQSAGRGRALRRSACRSLHQRHLPGGASRRRATTLLTVFFCACRLLVLLKFAAGDI